MKKLAAGVTAIAAVAALAVPSQSQAQDGIDLEDACAATIGSQSGVIDLYPVIRVYYGTCENADADN